MKHSFRNRYTAFLMYGVATSALLAPTMALAVNIDPNLAAGSAMIGKVGNVTTVTQATQKAIYNATSLDTNAAETLNVNMQQGITSIGLFKVSGAATKFDGMLNSNGQVWVINPNGAVFGSTAKVNVGGLLVSTAGISNDNFLNPGVGTNGGNKYIFDAAGNPQAAIVVKGGAQITAKYPDGSFEVKITEKGGEIGAGGTAPVGQTDAQDLTNWILTPGTSVDSKNSNDTGKLGTGVDHHGWDYDADFDASKHSQFFDLEGTSGPINGSNEIGAKSPAVLTSKKAFDLAPGEYNINFDVAGSNRSYGGSVKDAMLIEVVDSSNKVLYSNRSVYDVKDGWKNTTLSFALDKPVTGLKLRISGQLEGTQTSPTSTDNLGVSLGKLDFAYRPYENPYVTFMAPAIKQETGSTVQALKVNSNGVQVTNGAINYAAGTTFEANHIDGTTVNSVKIMDPVKMAAIIDGKPATSAIEIQQGAQLWAALVPDSPMGTVTLQAKVEQGVFNTNFDKNGNGTDQHTPTYGPLGQVYDNSEIITIENGADIRPSPTGTVIGQTPEGSPIYGSPVTPNNNLIIAATIVPGGTTPPVTPPVTPPAFDQNLQVAPPVTGVTFAQLSARDVVGRSFVNAQDSVNPVVSINNGLSLTPNGTTGGAVAYTAAPVAASYANIAPAAGTPAPVASDASRYATLAPAAGGKKPATVLKRTKVTKRVYDTCGNSRVVTNYVNRRVASARKGTPVASNSYADLAPAAGGVASCATPATTAMVAPAPAPVNAAAYSDLSPAAGSRTLGGTGEAVNVACANATLDTGFLGARPECRQSGL